jgi:hypothetical protein
MLRSCRVMRGRLVVRGIHDYKVIVVGQIKSVKPRGAIAV